MSSFPYVATSNVFNTADYRILNEGLTRDTADKLYLSLGGGLINGNLNINGTLSLNGSAIDLSLISGVIAGTPQNSKVLSLDSLGKINGDLTLTGALNSTNLNVSGVSTVSNTRINTLTNYNGVMDTACIVLRHPNNTNGNRVSIDFSISGNVIDSVNTATCSITHERISTYQGVLIFNTKRVATATAPLVEALRIKQSGSCVINNTNNTDYQLDLGSSGSGINTSSLIASSITLNGLDIESNLNLLVSVIPGTAKANKALVLNSSLNISGINDLSSSYLETKNTSNSIITNSTNGSLYGLHLHSVLTASNGIYSGSSIAFNNSDTDNVPLAGICLDKIASGNGQLIIRTRNGSTCDERMRLTSAGVHCNRLSIGTLDFGYSPRMLNMIDNTLTAGQDRFLTMGKTYTTNNSMEWGYIHVADGSTSNRMDFSFFGVNGILSVRADRRVGINQTAPSCALDVLGDIKASERLILTKNGYGLSHKNVLGVELITYIDNTTAWFGTVLNNDLVIQTGASERMRISSNGVSCGVLNCSNVYSSGRVGIGNSSPNCPLQVNATNASITIIPSGTISYSYDVSSNTWTNRGGGPFTLTNVSANFGGNIYIQTGIWATSDKRLKENIKEIDLPFERYKALKPVSYNYKQEDKSRVGFIAQDVIEVCSQAITMTANENLHDEGLNSPEGVQLSMDYNAIIVLNTNIIQKLIERVELLENELKNIKSNIQ